MWNFQLKFDKTIKGKPIRLSNDFVNPTSVDYLRFLQKKVLTLGQDFYIYSTLATIL